MAKSEKTRRMSIFYAHKFDPFMKVKGPVALLLILALLPPPPLRAAKPDTLWLRQEEASPRASALRMTEMVEQNAAPAGQKSGLEELKEALNPDQPVPAVPGKGTKETTVSLRMLDDRQAEGLVDILRKNVGSYLPPLDTAGRFVFGKKIYGFERGGGKTSYRVGPLFFFSLFEIYKVVQSRLEILESGSLDVQIRDLVKTYTQSLEKNLGQQYRDYVRNIFFIAPYSAVPGVPLNDHTAAVVASMVAHADDFQGAVVIDAGAGSGPLQAVALALGAHYVIGVDNDVSELRLGSSLLKAQGWREGDIDQGDFKNVVADFTDADQLKPLVELLAKSQRPVIVLVNIGPWTMYGDTNRKSLETLASLPKLHLIINGGYSFESEDHHSEFYDTGRWLSENGFVVDYKEHEIGVGTLIATKLSGLEEKDQQPVPAVPGTEEKMGRREFFRRGLGAMAAAGLLLASPLAAAPSGVPSRRSLAELLYGAAKREPDYEKKMRLLRKLIGRDPASPLAEKALGDLVLLQRAFDARGALKTLRKWLRDVGKPREHYTWDEVSQMVYLLRYVGRVDEAKRELEWHRDHNVNVFLSPHVSETKLPELLDEIYLGLGYYNQVLERYPNHPIREIKERLDRAGSPYIFLPTWISKTPAFPVGRKTPVMIYVNPNYQRRLDVDGPQSAQRLAQTPFYRAVARQEKAFFRDFIEDLSAAFLHFSGGQFGLKLTEIQFAEPPTLRGQVESWMDLATSREIQSKKGRGLILFIDYPAGHMRYGGDGLIYVYGPSMRGPLVGDEPSLKSLKLLYMHEILHALGMVHFPESLIREGHRFRPHEDHLLDDALLELSPPGDHGEFLGLSTPLRLHLKWPEKPWIRLRPGHNLRDELRKQAGLEENQQPVPAEPGTEAGKEAGTGVRQAVKTLVINLQSESVNGRYRRGQDQLVSQEGIAREVLASADAKTFMTPETWGMDRSALLARHESILAFLRGQVELARTLRVFPVLLEDSHTPSVAMHVALTDALKEEPYIFAIDAHTDVIPGSKLIDAANVWGAGIALGYIRPDRLIMIGPEEITRFVTGFLNVHQNEQELRQLLSSVPDMAPASTAHFDKSKVIGQIANALLETSTITDPDTLKVIVEAYLTPLILFKSGVTLGALTDEGQLTFVRWSEERGIEKWDMNSLAGHLAGNPRWLSFDTDVLWPQGQRQSLIDLAQMIGKGAMVGVHVAELRESVGPVPKGLGHLRPPGALGFDEVRQVIEATLASPAGGLEEGVAEAIKEHLMPVVDVGKGAASYYLSEDALTLPNGQGVLSVPGEVYQVLRKYRLHGQEPKGFALTTRAPLKKTGGYLYVDGELVSERTAAFFKENLDKIGVTLVRIESGGLQEKLREAQDKLAREGKPVAVLLKQETDLEAIFKVYPADSLHPPVGLLDRDSVWAGNSGRLFTLLQESIFRGKVIYLDAVPIVEQKVGEEGVNLVTFRFA